MSGIFGIFHRDGRPVAPESLAAMRQTMAHWGPDGSRVVHEGEVGLGQLMLHNTPESLNESLPRKTADGLLFTAGARIDNRDELFDALDVPSSDRADLPDGSLILRAYREWGAGCADRLLGDWAFAIWDPRRRRLLLARDHYGNNGLYYYSSPRLFAFASSIKGLLALPEVPRRPNQLRIAQVLTNWLGDVGQTCYEDNLRLPPAHTLTVTPEMIEMHRFWDLEDTPELRLGSDEEYLEAFLEHYGEAVRCRLRSHRQIGVTLSGGLDSSSVAALAARELARDDRRLRAFSLVPLHDVEGLTAPSLFGDERPFIEATRRFVGNLDVTYIRAEKISPLAGIERALDLHDEPWGSGGHCWVQALLATARAGDVGTLLIGQGGNGTVSWAGQEPNRLLSSLKRGQWSALRERLRQSVRALGVWATIRGQVVGPLVPSWRRRYRRLRAGRDPWIRYSPINREMARSLDLTRLMKHSDYDPTFTRRRDERAVRYALIRPGAWSTWFEAGAGYALEARDPTVDKRLMTFCLSVPDHLYADDSGDRLLLRRGLEGLLPRKVLWNELIGRQVADIGQRVLHDAAALERALERLERSDLARGYLDLPRMRAVWGTLQQTIDRQITFEVEAILLRGITVGLFLQRFETVGH